MRGSDSWILNYYTVVRYPTYLLSYFWCFLKNRQDQGSRSCSASACLVYLF